MWPKKKTIVKSDLKYATGPEESVTLHDGSVASLRRVIARRDIPRYDVKKGDLGGYIEISPNLSQMGDAWIGGNASVRGHVKVQDNALVTGEAIVYANQKSNELWSWVGEESLVKDKATIAGKEFVISGKAQVLDSAHVWESKISGSAVAKEESIINNSAMRSDSVASGRCKIFDTSVLESAIVTDDATVSGSRLSGTSFVGGFSRIEKSKIRENTHISGRVKIKEGVVCEGTNKLSGDLIIPPNYYVFNKVLEGVVQESFFGVLDSGQSTSTEINKVDSIAISNNNGIISSLLGSSYTQTLQSLESEYKTYSTDIVKLIKYPLMVDPSVEETQNFIYLLRQAKRLVTSKDTTAQDAMLEKLERAYLVAEAKALKVASSLYSEAERKKTEDAKVFITKACDKNSTDAEKKIGFRSTMKSLEGIIAVPEDAITAFREKIGLLEIEA